MGGALDINLVLSWVRLKSSLYNNKVPTLNKQRFLNNYIVIIDFIYTHSRV